MIYSTTKRLTSGSDKDKLLISYLYYKHQNTLYQILNKYKFGVPYFHHKCTIPIIVRINILYNMYKLDKNS